jgi:preprotein translocase subunit YajC
MIFFQLQASGGGLGLIFPLLILAFFYFFMIRPGIKKQKEQKTFEEEIKKGDEVVTASGIIGTINKIDDKTYTLELDNKSYVRIVKSAVSKEMTEQYKNPKA